MFIIYSVEMNSPLKQHFDGFEETETNISENISERGSPISGTLNNSL